LLLKERDIQLANQTHFAGDEHFFLKKIKKIFSFLVKLKNELKNILRERIF
jgi:hypothetical protein